MQIIYESILSVVVLSLLLSASVAAEAPPNGSPIKGRRTRKLTAARPTSRSSIRARSATERLRLAACR
jgi:hypothetical protein